LWEGKVVPRKLSGAPYSRSYMRKAWRDILRDVDRSVTYVAMRNHWNAKEALLRERRIYVAKRRAFRFE
jgi:hypothetical protein